MSGRSDFDVITALVPYGARVLDVGCGDGELLERLVIERGALARGLELSQAGVNASVQRGLAVVQGDADADLAFYPDGGFDMVIMSKSIQATRRPRKVLDEIARIGRAAIVSFPNFGHWRTRLSLLSAGRMPVTRSLPVAWHETENIHLCTIVDFVALAREAGFTVEQIVPMENGRAGRPRGAVPGSANWTAEEAIVTLRAPTAPR